jgi:2-oxoglutarate dehydrogenase E1 component
VKTSEVKVVNFCSGKVYYDLLEKQEKEERKDVAIVRIEQLYPLPERQMEAIFKKYPKAKFNFVQEEPKNMGYWMHMLRYEFRVKLQDITRRSSASPATGYASVHKKEQDKLVELAFNLD